MPVMIGKWEKFNLNILALSLNIFPPRCNYIYNLNKARFICSSNVQKQLVYSSKEYVNDCLLKTIYAPTPPPQPEKPAAGTNLKKKKLIRH